ncbi:hypothetical protein ACFCX4_33980, partial [Kitasatospora sp. NPDC056327]
MATSDGGGGGDRLDGPVWAFLRSPRHRVAGGSSVVVGVVTFLLDAPWALPPLLGVGLYTATVLLWRPPDDGGRPPGHGPGGGPGRGAGPTTGPSAVTTRAGPGRSGGGAAPPPSPEE